MYGLLGVACNWIGVCGGLGGGVGGRTIGLGRREGFGVVTSLAAMIAHVIDDDVIGEARDVTEADVINAWFNIATESDIVKDFFEDDEIDVLWSWVADATDTESEVRFDVEADVEISDVIFDFLIWCSSICL